MDTQQKLTGKLQIIGLRSILLPMRGMKTQQSFFANMEQMLIHLLSTIEMLCILPLSEDISRSQKLSFNAELKSMLMILMVTLHCILHLKMDIGKSLLCCQKKVAKLQKIERGLLPFKTAIINILKKHFMNKGTEKMVSIHRTASTLTPILISFIDSQQIQVASQLIVLNIYVCLEEDHLERYFQ